MATTILSRNLLSVVASTTGVGGTAVNVDIGYVPSYVRCLDVTNGSIEFVWSQGLNGATGGSSITGYFASSSAGGDVQFSTIAAGAGGLSSLDGSAGTGIGFVIGTNTTINLAGHAYHCMAWR